METKEGTDTGSSGPLRLAIFDDAGSAIDYYKNKLFKEHLAEGKVAIRSFITPSDDLERLRSFAPDLIIVDLVMGRGRLDGYNLIRKLQENGILESVPTVICSKLINESVRGKEERARAERITGVKAVFEKYPPAEDLLQFAQKA